MYYSIKNCGGQKCFFITLLVIHIVTSLFSLRLNTRQNVGVLAMERLQHKQHAVSANECPVSFSDHFTSITRRDDSKKNRQ